MLHYIDMPSARRQTLARALRKWAEALEADDSDYNPTDFTVVWDEGAAAWLVTQKDGSITVLRFSPAAEAYVARMKDGYVP